MDVKQPPLSGHDYQDADANLLLYKTGKSVKDFLLWIGSLFKSLGNALMRSLLFLMRNILWLFLGAALGTGYGVYKIEQAGAHYESTMTAKANFNSARALYNTLEYLNSLISSGDSKTLAELFAIAPEQTKQLISFSAEPVKSEMLVAEMYREQFLQGGRNRFMQQDTVWAHTLSFKNFKESLTVYDYYYHTITAVTTNALLFNDLQKGILKHISRNEVLTTILNSQIRTNNDEEKLIVAAIRNLDTLRQAYNLRLIKGQTPGESNQLVFMEKSSENPVPELELYDKVLELQDELKTNRKRSVIEQYAITVFSPFNPLGRKLSYLQQNVIHFALAGFLITLTVLLLILIYKSLLSYEKAAIIRKRKINPEA